MLAYILLIAGFILLIKGADALVEGASSFARRFNVTDMAIGLTIVAFGTSAPELFVNVLSSIKGTAGIAVGNVLGSNIANILLVLGAAALVRPLSVGRGTVWKEIPFCLLAALLTGVLLVFPGPSGDPGLGRIDGIVMLAFFFVFMVYAFAAAREGGEIPEDVPGSVHGARTSLIFIIAGLAGLILGARFIVDNAVVIAQRAGVDDVFIGLTVVAVGTTLPELATSIVAAFRGKMDIAVGNVIGSNIFNLLLILGISSVSINLPFGAVEIISTLVMIAVSVVIFLTMFTGRRHVLDKWEGALFLVMYVIYIVYLFKTV